MKWRQFWSIGGTRPSSSAKGHTWSLDPGFSCFRQPMILPIFAENCMKMMTFGPDGGVPCAPLVSANDVVVQMKDTLNRPLLLHYITSGGSRGAPSPVTKSFSMLCSFRGILIKSYPGAPHPHRGFSPL